MNGFWFNQAGASLPGGMKVALCVAAAAFVFQLETFAVAVALPAMATHFSMNKAQMALVPLLYLLAASVIFVPAGRWADQYGLKRGFVAGVMILCVGSMLCGLAPNATTLLLARVLQGLGGGCMAALGYALIPARLPHARMGSAMGLVSFAAAAGLMSGAPLGGFLTALLSWRWALLAAAPLAGLLAVAAAWAIPKDPPAVLAARPAGARGSILLAVALGGLLLGLGLGPVWGWRSPRVAGLLLLAVAGMSMLAWHEKTTRTPVITPSIWKQPGLILALATLGLVRSVVGGVAFLMPFYVEGLCAQSAAVSGCVMLGYTTACALTGLGAGALADRAGSRPLIRAAMCLGGLGCLCLAAVAPLASVRWTALALGVLGAGTGLFFSPNSRFTLARAPAGHAGEVAALMALVLNTGTALGVAGFSALQAGLAGRGSASLAQALSMVAAAGIFGVAARLGWSRRAYGETTP